MNKSKIILFIAKSLSISVNNKNLEEIKETLKFQYINWDLFIKISTSQLVLPSLYCNYKRKKLLSFFPDELVAYMKYITSLNRDRNLKVIEQINRLNNLLKQNKINPIFFKGANYLIQGLYDDLAERMVGDIDFLVPNNEYDLAAKILLDNNYKSVSNLGYNFPNFKHFPRLCNENEIAAVEIHKEMVIEKHAKEFNFETIKSDIISKNGFSFLSNDNQKAITIFSNQINDHGYEYKTIKLKNAYDFLLLNNINSSNDFAYHFDKLRTPIMFFLNSVNYLFGDIGLQYENNQKVNQHFKKFKSLLHNPIRNKFHSKIIGFKLFLIVRIKIIFKSIVNKEYRAWLIKRVLDKKWQREKLVQFKLKKTNKTKLSS